MNMHCFNSTTVQLIRPMPIPAVIPVSFQFHNGTINTSSSAHACIFPFRFNSTTVQLIRLSKK